MKSRYFPFLLLFLLILTLSHTASFLHCYSPVFPTFSTISPGWFIFPLLVVVTITAVKDAYEGCQAAPVGLQSQSQIGPRPLREAIGFNPNVMQRKSKTFVPGACVHTAAMSKNLNVPNEREALVGVTVTGV